MLGKLLEEFTPRQTLQIAHVPKGIYFLNLIDKNGIKETHKWIKD